MRSMRLLCVLFLAGLAFLPTLAQAQYVQTIPFYTVTIQDMDSVKLRQSDVALGKIQYSDFAGSEGSAAFADLMYGELTAGTAIKIPPLASGQEVYGYVDIALPSFDQDVWIGEINAAVWLDGTQSGVNICPTVVWEVFNFCSTSLQQSGTVFPDTAKAFSGSTSPSAITTTGTDLGTQFRATYSASTGFQRTAATSNFISGPDGLFFLSSVAGCTGVRVWLGRTNKTHSSSWSTTTACGSNGADTGTSTNMYLKSLSITFNKCTTTPCTSV